MNRFIKYTLFLGSLSVLMISCTEPIDLDLNEGDNQKLVVNAWLDDGNYTQFIELSKTTNYYDTIPTAPVTGATVEVHQGGNTFVFAEAQNGRYELNGDMNLIEGSEYELEINYAGSDYSSKSIAKRVPQFDAVALERTDETFPNGEILYDVLMTFTEPAGATDYYYFSTFKSDQDPIRLAQEGNWVSDELVDGNLIEEVEIASHILIPGDTMKLQMLSISKGFFEYLDAIESETVWRGGLFDTPRANVPNNILGNAVGYFQVSMLAEEQAIAD